LQPKRATIHQVAHRADVSHQTVSRYLRNNGGLKPATVAKVQTVDLVGPEGAAADRAATAQQLVQRGEFDGVTDVEYRREVDPGR
jgi:transcriptional regulator with XRE-family HTH domain